LAADKVGGRQSIDFYILPVADPPNPISLSLVTGLLLNPTGKATGQYQRTGAFEFDDKELSLRFMEIRKNPECHAKDEEYVEISADENGRTIRLIELVLTGAESKGGRRKNGGRSKGVQILGYGPPL